MSSHRKMRIFIKITIISTFFKKNLELKLKVFTLITLIVRLKMHCGSVERTKTTNCVFIQQITDQTLNLYSASVPSLVETTTGTVLQFPMFDLVTLWLEPRCHSSKIFTFLKYRLGDTASQKLGCFFKLHNVCQEKTVLALYSHRLAVYFFVIRMQHFYC